MNNYLRPALHNTLDGQLWLQHINSNAVMYRRNKRHVALTSHDSDLFV